ncbi:MAG TPA: HupE/UreJ family protein [Gammaproteobacteria bacterium]
MSRPLLAFAVLAALTAGSAAAHEFDPGYLSLTETAAGRFDVQWKVSISGGLYEVLVPRLPGSCELDSELRTYVVRDAQIQTTELACPEGIAGLTLAIGGLPSTQTDALVRIDYLNGASFVSRLTPDDPMLVVPEQPSAWELVWTYFVLGVEHILIGIDHLLFVLALLLLIRGVRRLVLTVTAFTVAHSITLAATTLGWMSVPGAPVEATIALSILFLATQLARSDAGREEAAADLTARFPWIVALSFGLLHGFGFAGALAEVGLPDRAIPLALLFFNVGVEAGQLLFIAVILTAGWLIRRIAVPIPEWWSRAVAYGVGSVAAYWVIDRSTWIV